MNKFIFLLASTPLFAACAADDHSASEVHEPSLDGKSDGFGDVEEGGLIEFGGEITDAFEEDFQFFAYTFDARENAEIRVEATQLGSSQGLDTTMFLYRMRDGEQPRRIAFDDDDGFGKLSRIDDFRLFEAGRYAVVLGTKSAEGRGNFRLTLTCEGDECGPIEPPPEACPAPMQDEFFDCVQDASQEFDFESNIDEVVADFCGTPQGLSDLRIVVCASQSHPWCEGDETIEACGQFAQASYPSPQRATDLLARTDNTPELQAVEDAAADSEFCGDLGADAGCEFFGFAFSHDPAETLTMPELLAHARTLATPGPGVYPEQDSGEEARAGFDTFMSFFDALDEANALIDSLGLDPADAEFGVASGPEFQFAFGDCEGSMVVVHFPAEGVVLDFHTLSCFG